MRTTKVHKVVVRMVFDKPCTRKDAVREARDNLHGEFYTTDMVAYGEGRESRYPEKFNVRGVTSARKVAR